MGRRKRSKLFVTPINKQPKEIQIFDSLHFFCSLCRIIITIIPTINTPMMNTPTRVCMSVGGLAGVVVAGGGGAGIGAETFGEGCDVNIQTPSMMIAKRIAPTIANLTAPINNQMRRLRAVSLARTRMSKSIAII